ncbi:MAG: hypothetical protein CVU49_04925 [Candidatus Cloacimonetes bacterium HGW-Cloacimonetes-2]|nr:MAG: hypothetical protein CVU49_04925 [Candidatus Cloacimonetes bacterium HGW-Cloacimonetes-2]
MHQTTDKRALRIVSCIRSAEWLIKPNSELRKAPLRLIAELWKAPVRFTGMTAGGTGWETTSYNAQRITINLLTD